MNLNHHYYHFRLILLINALIILYFIIKPYTCPPKSLFIQILLLLWCILKHYIYYCKIPTTHLQKGFVCCKKTLYQLKSQIRLNYPLGVLKTRSEIYKIIWRKSNLCCFRFAGAEFAGARVHPGATVGGGLLQHNGYHPGVLCPGQPASAGHLAGFLESRTAHRFPLQVRELTPLTRSHQPLNRLPPSTATQQVVCVARSSAHLHFKWANALESCLAAATPPPTRLASINSLN